jgi:adenylate kinase
MLACPRWGNDAEYLSDEGSSLLRCDFCGTPEMDRRARQLAGQARRIVLLGPPGAGKGTQAVRLAGRFSVPHIATGDIFREHLRRGSPLGRVVKRYIDGGELVPDDLVIDIVSERLVQPDCRHGFVLDGFPRSVPQAWALTRSLDELGMPLDAVISLEVEEGALFGRLATRARADDTEQTIRMRLRVFAASNGPLLRYYQERGLLVRIDGVGHPDQIAERLVARLEGLLAPSLAERRPVEVALALTGGR